MNDYRKKPQPRNAEPVLVRDLVAKWGDDWALMAPVDSFHWKNVLTEKTHDIHEASLMNLMERGVRGRVDPIDLLRAALESA